MNGGDKQECIYVVLYGISTMTVMHKLKQVNCVYPLPRPHQTVPRAMSPRQVLRARFGHQLDVVGAEHFTLVPVDRLRLVLSPSPDAALVSVMLKTIPISNNLLNYF